MFAFVINGVCFACSCITLHKDPNVVYTDGARPANTFIREPLLKVKDQYGWLPFTTLDQIIFILKILFTFYKTTYLNVDITTRQKNMYRNKLERWSLSVPYTKANYL